MRKEKSKWIVEYFKDWKNILTIIFLFLLVAAGFFLRIRNLGYLSFWGDDGHTFIGTMSILEHGYPLLPSGNILFHGILDYYLNVVPVLIFGAGEFAFRITNVFFGLSTIILIYFVGKDIANKFVGFLGAFLITFSTWFIQFSREARYFAALQFFFLVSSYFFYKGFIQEKKLFKILAVIFFIITPLIHGMGFILLLFFIVLLFLKGREFFRKKIIIPLLIIFFFDVLQIINQVFFWKVGRSFYASGGGIKSLMTAYFRLPDPYYFKIIKIMFPKMFTVFIFGVFVFIGLTILLSVKKVYKVGELYLNENELRIGKVRLPFNILMLYVVFILALTLISFGQMYNQQRYIYFLMPLFILIFSYTVFVISIFLFRWFYLVIKKAKKIKSRRVYNTAAHLALPLIFIAVSFFTVNGVNIKEAVAIADIKHTDNLNTFYSISTTMTYHWDAAEAGRYVASHADENDIVITTDIYNSYPYTRKIDYWLWTGSLVSWQPYHEESGEIRDDTYGAVVVRDIFKFIDIFNDNYNKDIWVIASPSLFNPGHVDPIFKEFLDSRKKNLVLVGRDNVSRLYFFPKISVKDRIQVTDFIPSTEDNTLKSDSNGLMVLDFTDEDYSNYLISGWGKIEAGLGTWGMDGRSILFISFSDSKENVLKLTAKPLPNPELIQKMDIILNNSRISEIELTNTNDFSEYTVKLKSEFIKEGVNILEFKYGYSFTPFELGISNDSRRLAVMFKKIEIGNLDK